MSELAQWSSRMSCDAMKELALKEFHDNRNALGYRLAGKCSELFDEGELRGLDLSRQLCFTHDPAFKAGDYFRQIGDKKTEEYELWTRRKDISGPYVAGEGMVYDLDYVFMNCYGKAVPTDVPCIYNDGTSVKRVTCPPKCRIAPSPCPNPWLMG